MAAENEHRGFLRPAAAAFHGRQRWSRCHLDFFSHLDKSFGAMEVPIIDLSPFLKAQEALQRPPALGLRVSRSFQARCDDERPAGGPAVASKERLRVSQDAQAVARAWRKAFAEFGFCQATGHGVPEEVIESTYATAQQFFQQPLAAKRQCASSSYGAASGYTARGGERVSATATARADGELAGAKRARPPDNVESMVFYGQPSDVVPDEVPGYRHTLQRYHQELRKLLATCMALTAVCLELPLDYFEAYFKTAGEQNEISLRLAHYPAYEKGREPAPGELRYGEHTDYTGFTLLWQDHNTEGPQCAKSGIKPPSGGLQVLSEALQSHRTSRNIEKTDGKGMEKPWFWLVANGNDFD